MSGTFVGNISNSEKNIARIRHNVQRSSNVARVIVFSGPGSSVGIATD